MEKILEVTEVKLAVLESFPPQLAINASGLVPTGGWVNPQLRPHVHVQPPSDGVYDFDFVADRPTGIVPQHVSPIHASYVMKTFPDALKGVRVQASQNSKTTLLDAGKPDRQPNRYTFSDQEGVKRVVFFPKELGPLGDGRPSAGPQLEYTGPEGRLTFRGDDISQEQTVLGTLISVAIKINADAGGLNFALALPPVHLAGEAKEFKTIGIMIHSRGRVRNPAGVEL
ncbi:MAG TPA: hypothetical protein VIU43_04770, partial [Nitrosospira sp.]